MPATQVDPVFAEVVRSIYGDEADPREVLEKFSPGPSDLHIDGSAPTAKQIKHQRTEAITGLGATGVAGVAGVDALRSAAKDNKRRKLIAQGVKVEPEGPGRVARGLAKIPGMTPKRAAVAIGGGLLGLHGVELLGDTLGAKSQIHTLRTTQNQPNTTAPQSDLTKAFRLRPLNPLGARVPSLRAKRPRTTPGGQMFGKAWFKRAKQAVNDVEDTASHARNAAAGAASAAHKINQLIPSRKAALIGGAAALGTVATTTAAGAYAGSRAGRNKQRPILIQASPPKARSLTRQLQGQQAVGKSITWTGEIAKVDVEKRQVFGWASVSSINGEPVVDLQGDIVPIEETEKAAYRYVLESRKGGDMHARVAKAADQPLHTADLIESFVVTPEKLAKMGLPPDALPHGWWIGMHVNDDKQWAMVKSGERTGFSLHGLGSRTAAVSKMTDEEQKHVKEGAVGTAAVGTVMGLRSVPAFRARAASKVFTNVTRAGKMAEDLRHAPAGPNVSPQAMRVGGAAGPLMDQAKNVKHLRQVNPDTTRVSPMVERYERTFRESRKIKAQGTQVPGPVKAFLAPTSARRQADSAMMHNLMRASGDKAESPALYRSMHMTGPEHKVGDKIDFGRASSWSAQHSVAEATRNNLNQVQAQVGPQMAQKLVNIPPGSKGRVYQREAGHAGLRIGAAGRLPQDEWLAGGVHEVTGTPTAAEPYYKVRPVPSTPSPSDPVAKGRHDSGETAPRKPVLHRIAYGPRHSADPGVQRANQVRGVLHRHADKISGVADYVAGMDAGMPPGLHGPLAALVAKASVPTVRFLGKGPVPTLPPKAPPRAPGKHRLMAAAGGAHRASDETNKWRQIERKSEHSWGPVGPKHLAKADMPGRHRTLDVASTGGRHRPAVAPKKPGVLITPKHSSSRFTNKVANPTKRAVQRVGVQGMVMEDKYPLPAKLLRWAIEKGDDPVDKALSDDVRDKVKATKGKLVRAEHRAGRSLKVRIGQARNPPPVKTRQVVSTAVREMGYQPQTRRLTYKFYGNPTKPVRSYTYRAKPSKGVAALSSPSKGHFYATQVKGKAKRVEPDSVTPMGRVRLFLDPQVNKALAGGGTP